MTYALPCSLAVDEVVFSGQDKWIRSGNQGCAVARQSSVM